MGRTSNMTPAELHCQKVIQDASTEKRKDKGLDTSKTFITIYRKTKLTQPPTPQLLAEHADKFFAAATRDTLGKNTIATYLMALAGVAKWCKLPEEVYKRFSEASMERARANNTATMNKLSEHQNANWVPLTELRKHFTDVLAPNYAAMKASGQVIHRTIQLYVVAYLNLYEPPIRGVYSDVAILLDRPDSDEKDNVLYLPPSGTAELYINHDKVIRHAKAAHWPLQPATTDMLRDTLKVWERSYVMADGPISLHKYGRLLGAALTVGDRTVNEHLIRTIWITEFVSSSPHLGGPAAEERRFLAERMRHSLSTQEQKYRRILDYPVAPPNPVAGMVGYTDYHAAPVPRGQPPAADQEAGPSSPPAQRAAPGGRARAAPHAPAPAPPAAAAAPCATGDCKTQVLKPDMSAAAKRARRYYENHREERCQKARSSYDNGDVAYRKLQRALLVRLEKCPGVKVTQASIDKYRLVCSRDGKWSIRA